MATVSASRRLLGFTALVLLAGLLTFFLSQEQQDSTPSFLRGFLLENKNVNGTPFTIITNVAHGETIPLTANVNAIITCPSSLPVPPFAMASPDPSTPGLRIYEFSSGFAQERLGNWIGEEYGYTDTSPPNTNLSQFKTGRTYYVTATANFNFQCSVSATEFALDFNGVDAMVGVPFSSGVPFDVDRTNAFSVSLWAKPTSTGSTISSYLFVRESGLGLTVLQLSGNKIIATIADDAGRSISRQSLSKYFVQGRYNHVVVTYDGSSVNSGLNMYLDNTLITTPAAGSNLIGETQDNSSLAIGGYTGCAGDCFNGNIDDVRFYRKQLSAAEVTNLFNQTGEPSNLVHHWKFDDGSGTIADDTVITGVNGTLLPSVSSFIWTTDTAF